MRESVVGPKGGAAYVGTLGPAGIHIEPGEQPAPRGLWHISSLEIRKSGASGVRNGRWTSSSAAVRKPREKATVFIFLPCIIN